MRGLARSALVAAVACFVAVAAWSAAAARNFAGDRAAIEAILAAHDRLAPGLETYMASVADDIVLIPQGGKMIEGKAEYRQHVMDFYASGSIQIRHEAIEIHSFPDVVIARGRATGTFTPPGGDATSSFETRNLFVFRRLADGKLQVWQIIFNYPPPAA